MTTWHYEAGGRANGPVDESMLKQLLASGVVHGASHVWREGMPAWAPLRAVPELAHLAPPHRVPPLSPGGVPPPLQPPVEADSTGGLIPYKNPKALVAYYLGVVALVPMIGIFIGIASITLGIKGLQARKQNPIIRGGAHAWVGIALGSFSLFYHLAALIFFSTR